MGRVSKKPAAAAVMKRPAASPNTDLGTAPLKKPASASSMSRLDQQPVVGDLAQVCRQLPGSTEVLVQDDGDVEEFFGVPLSFAGDDAVREACIYSFANNSLDTLEMMAWMAERLHRDLIYCFRLRSGFVISAVMVRKLTVAETRRMSMFT